MICKLGSFDVWWEALKPRAVCVTWTQKDRNWNTLLWPYPLSGPGAHMALVCTAADREPGWLCAHYSSWREDARSGREAAGWLPRPASSPGPNTALMRARGADGHTQGARDYCPWPKGAREKKIQEDKRQEVDQEGRLQSFWKQQADNHCYVSVMDIHYLEYVSKCACRYMYILYIICIMFTDYQMAFYIWLNKRPSQSGDCRGVNHSRANIRPEKLLIIYQ